MTVADRAVDAFRDPSRAVEERADDLLARMTLDERLAQLGSCWVLSMLDDMRFSPARADRVLHHGIGQVTRPAGATTLGDVEVRRLGDAVQHHLLTRTRLGVPAVLHEESLHGYLARDAVVFPQAIGMAATWDTDLVETVAAAVGAHVRANGATQSLAPVLDLGQDPRWGRIEETLGEDPVLVAELAAAHVRGLRRSGVAATAKHLVGHGRPEGGRNRGPVHAGERELRDELLYPFEVAVRRERVGAVMPAYTDLDGVPCTGSRWLLSQVLRAEWGFDGVVVSDYNGIEELVDSHAVDADLAAAAARALRAGVDVELPATVAYGDPLRRALDRGLVSTAEVDATVRRVLLVKLRAGLFERPYAPGGPVDLDGHRRLARASAARSTVLLRNDGVLPLRSPRSVALVGPVADSARELLGGYAHRPHLESLAEVRDGDNVFAVPVPADLALDGHAGGSTLRSALRDALGDVVAYAPGCALTGEDRDAIAAAARLAAGSEVAVVAVGDRSGLTDECTTGEARDRLRLGLPGVQEDLVRAVVATGTPTVVVSVSGRPPSLGWAAEHAAALLHAWVPGQEGAAAVADVLTGRTEPGGRLPVTVVRDVGQVPLTYRHKPSGGRSHWKGDYVDGPAAPLFPFGHGLSWTRVELADLRLASRTVRTDGVLELSLLARNAGDVAGSEIIQVYVRDDAAQVTRPVRELVAWTRVSLAPGQAADVRVRVPAAFLSFHGLDLRRVVEPGAHQVWVGRSSVDLPLHARFELTGPVRPVPDRAAAATTATWRVLDQSPPGRTPGVEPGGAAT